MKVVVLTGAGISAESGVPTFREAQTGLWARFSAQELATPEAFAKNPELVWDWYAWRRELVRAAQPNAGHLGLVELEGRVSDFLLVTQNVDGLHERAGSRKLLELHGNIARTKCSRDGKLAAELPATQERPPRCTDCGARLRPDVVWFGETLDPGILRAAERAASMCDVFISIGTSAEVYPAASLPQAAKSVGARVIEINPHATPVSAFADEVLREPAGSGVPKLLELLAP